MAVDMFIKIDDIKGEAKDHAHEGEIDVLSWSWGMTQSGTAHVGGGGGAGKVSVQDLTIVKNVDRSSTDLMQMCCKGTHFQNAELVIRKATGDDPLEYIKICMHDGLISSVSSGAASGDGPETITETVTLNFAKVEYKYTPQADSTGAPEAETEMTWNIAANTV